MSSPPERQDGKGNEKCREEKDENLFPTERKEITATIATVSEKERGMVAKQGVVV